MTLGLGFVLLKVLFQVGEGVPGRRNGMYKAQKYKRECFGEKGEIMKGCI